MAEEKDDDMCTLLETRLFEKNSTVTIVKIMYVINSEESACNKEQNWLICCLNTPR